MTTLNVEADEVLYRAAFAVERKGWILTTTKGNTRDFGSKYSATMLKKLLKEIGKVFNVDYTLESYQITEPVSHCLRIIRNTIKRLEKYGEVRLWLTSSDKSNFRFSVAKTKGPKGLGYKAGRPPRPVHYQAARDYLIDRCGAKEIFGYEADDALAMYQTDDTIATHIDKDINMVVGRHLNWVTMEFYESPTGFGTVEYNDKGKIIGRGVKFFYHQLLTGDATDNILGIKGIGDKTAYNLLKDTTDELEAVGVVLEVYKNKYSIKRTHIITKNGLEFFNTEDTAITILLEMADLLWMCRTEGDYGSLYLAGIIRAYYGVYG